MTPFEWTNGRLFATAASLFVLISGQVLKWQEPSSALAEAIQRLLWFCRRPLKAFSSGKTL